MNVHLITLFGHPTEYLIPMLDHYAKLGVKSFWIYVHQNSSFETSLEEIRALTSQYGDARVEPAAGDWLSLQHELLRGMQTCPDDWFILVDHDELQQYPDELGRILSHCDDRGFDHIKGCFVDRFAEDGTLRKLNPREPIAPQYPIGAFFTAPVCRANVNKVVAAKGRLEIGTGHHSVKSGGVMMPAEELLVQIHHFKWVDGLVEYLSARCSPESEWDEAVRREAIRFISYYYANGNRIGLGDYALLAAPCEPSYPHWDFVRQRFLQNQLARKIDVLYEKVVGPG